MSQSNFRRSIELASPPSETFAWHVRPGALRRLMPPFESARVVAGSGPTEPLRQGARTTIRVGVGPVGLDWVAEIAELDHEALRFVDEQVSGPFKSWRHSHIVEGLDGGSSRLTDDIAYEVPLGALGGFFGGAHVRSKLERMFAWRHRTMVHDLAAHGRASEAGFGSKTFAITGASGLVGGTLAAFLRTGGHRVLELVRREPRAEHEVRWDPSAGTVDHAALEGVDVLVHLAGESIFGLRWTAEKKRRVVMSRVRGTRAIVDAVRAMQRPPATCVFASAIGYYGDRGDEVMTEGAERGTGFLADTCVQWEGEALRLPGGVREVRTRFGIVLDPSGGALATMLPAFKAGVAGPLGSGQQWFPWVALDDVLGAIHFAAYRTDVSGPVNVVAPYEVRNAEFTKTLASVLRRPALLPAPKFALRAAIGTEQAEEMLLASVRVRPEALERAGFSFARRDLRGALEHCLGRV